MVFKERTDAQHHTLQILQYVRQLDLQLQQQQDVVQKNAQMAVLEMALV
jgi:hypothetical protein